MIFKVAFRCWCNCAINQLYSTLFTNHGQQSTWWFSWWWWLSDFYDDDDDQDGQHNDHDWLGDNITSKHLNLLGLISGKIYISLSL